MDYNDATNYWSRCSVEDFTKTDKSCLKICNGRNCQATSTGGKFLFLEWILWFENKIPMMSKIKELYNSDIYWILGTCDDGKQNQGEDGVDCGGPCSKECGMFNLILWTQLENRNYFYIISLAYHVIRFSILFIGGGVSCFDKPSYAKNCKTFSWACKDSRYPWFRQQCKKTCGEC